jgi:hypothetical protein
MVADMHTRLEERVVDRCLDELARAMLYRRALRGLYSGKTDHGIDFVRLASLALYDQMFTHAIKVLHPREKAGLWYILRRRRKEVAQICAEHAIVLGHVRGIAKGLLLVRNKIHFHLDKRGVRDPAKIWEEASITGLQFDAAVDAGFRLLCQFHKRVKGTEYGLQEHIDEYDGADAMRIVTLADHADLLTRPLNRGVKVTYLTEYGFWLLTSQGEKFLSFWNFPWFHRAPVPHILNVKEPVPGHYHWPDLDVDLSLEIIRNPGRFPLTAKAS